MNRIRPMIVALLLVGPLAAHADPIGFNFEQGGFYDGYGGEGYVTGMFYGEDIDGNGQLSSFADEITGFMMSFSGNTMVDSFSLGFDTLFGLVYDLDGGPLGDGLDLDIEGIASMDQTYGYLAGGAVGVPCGIGFDCAVAFNGETGAAAFSQELVTVTSKVKVPEPGTLALFGIGLFGMGLARRRQKV